MACPALQDLAELLVGKSADADVRAHVKGCTTCSRRLAQLSNTTLAPSGKHSIELAKTETPRSPSTELAETETPDSPPQRASMRLLARGAPIGRYIVSELLGAGGMGVVYAAYDPQLDRRVAVKVLRSGFARNVSGARQLLLDEAKAMAKLSHPNVVTVHDVGVLEEDQVFLAMELVEGQTLRELMRSKPPAKELVTVLVEAGRGLAAAHAAGLVHRDFKPENVLIGRDGRVCVTDFGVARTAQVDSKDVAGTPLYMAPEAHEGVIDPRSDQYSFCVTLLEIFSGAPPAIEPAAQIDKAPHDMRRILVRGLAKEPQDRFASMDALLQELAPSRRRAAWIAGAAAVAIAGSTIAVVGVTRGGDEPCSSAQAELAPTWSQQAARDVRIAFASDPKLQPGVERAVKEIDAWSGRWIAEHTRVCRATEVDRTQSVELLDLRMECLRGRASAIGAIVEQLKTGDRGALAYVATSVPNAGDLVRCAGDKDALRSLAVLKDPVLAGKADQLRAELAAVEAKHWGGRAKTVAADADALAKKADGLGVPLVAAPARFYAAYAHAQLSDKVTATASLRSAILDADRAGDDELRLRAQITLAQVYSVENKGEAAEELLAAAEATVGRLGKRPEHVAAVDTQRAKLWFVQGRYEEALELSRAATEKFDRAGKYADPAAVSARLLVGMNLEALGKPDEARAVYEQTVAELDAKLGKDSPYSAAPLAYIGAMELSQGKTDRARMYLERAVGILDAALGGEAIQTTIWRGQLAVIYAGAGEVDKARTTLQQGLAIANGPGARVERGSLLGSLGDVERNAGNMPAAIAAYDETIAIFEAHFGAEHPALIEFLARRADAARTAKQFDIAKRDLERAITITRTNKLGDLDQLEYYRGLNAKEAARTDEAKSGFEECIAARVPQSQALLIAECERELAELLVTSDRSRAIKLMQRARAAFAEAGEKDVVAELDVWLAARGR